MKKKVFIIALDGADYNLTKSMLPRMPNLNKLVQQGISLKLGTTTPNISPTAWASFMTGTLPAKHRILDFTSRDNKGNPVDFSLLRGNTLWKILSDADKKVVVFNVPVTFPPEKVNGILISGFPVPTGAKNYTYPQSVAGELGKQGWDFSDVPTQSYSSRMLTPFLADLIKRLSQRTNATLSMMEKYPWDFFMVHFMETDKILHEFLNFTRRDLVSRKDYKNYKTTVEDFFCCLDEHLGKILERLGEEVNVIVVSDHGFSPCRQSFYTNTWLLEKGYLMLKSDLLTKFKYALFKTFLSPIHLYNYLPDRVKRRIRKQVDEKYYQDSKQTKPLARFLQFLVSFTLKSFLLSKNDIDWDKTTAYPIGNAAITEIFVNRDVVPNPEQVLAELKLDLQKLIDPMGNKPLFNRIVSGRDAFGENDDLADLVAFDYNFETISINHFLFLSNRCLTKNFWFPNRASHNMEGIFIASGPDFVKGIIPPPHENLEQVHIIDCAPTILHLFGLSVPNRMDGKVKKEIFTPGTEAASSDVKIDTMSTVSAKKEFYWEEEEEREVKDRLREMGYL